MKSIDQLFKENGEKFPLVIRAHDWDNFQFFEILGVSHKKNWIGWDEKGNGRDVSKRGGQQEIWLPYKKPSNILQILQDWKEVIKDFHHDDEHYVAAIDEARYKKIKLNLKEVLKDKKLLASLNGLDTGDNVRYVENN
jgi:hypothetical protein